MNARDSTANLSAGGESCARLAYLILLHKQPDQAARMIRAIHDADNFYLVHVDARSPETVLRHLQHALSDLDNVRFMKQRPCKWGSWGMVEVELAGIQELLDWSADWQHYVNLSGQDFPLVEQAEIRRFLGERPEANLAEIQDPLQPGNTTSVKERRVHFSRWRRFYLNAKCPWKRQRLLSLPIVRRGFPAGFRWYRGSQWRILSRAFCSYVTDPNSHGVQPLTRFFRRSECADENFFPTVLMNSTYRHSVDPDYRRYIVWPGPKLLTIQDYDHLRVSKAFFARKFDAAKDSEILLRLETDLIRR